MFFESLRERALRETHEVGLTEAMNYLLDSDENEKISDAISQPKVESADQQTKEKQKRLAAAQAKLKEIRAQKAEQEAKEAIEKELRRRREGQSVAQAEEERKRREMKEWAEAKKREKREEELARRRVLEQIKMDREAQKALGMATNTSPQLVKQDVVTASPAASSCTSSRLQASETLGSALYKLSTKNHANDASLRTRLCACYLCGLTSRVTSVMVEKFIGRILVHLKRGRMKTRPGRSMTGRQVQGMYDD
uniref:UBX domain-containing protein n=1 Tax=Parascaris equorum TaxID=6256 RepID=A0A914RN24_PAREQ